MELAEKQMGFQREMSNTAYQRAMTDIRAAGINPLLMTPGGASTPSGAMASLNVPQPGKIGAGLASSAKDAVTLAVGLENQKADTDLKHDTSGKVVQESMESARRTANIQQDTYKKAEEVRKARADADMAERENKLSKMRYPVDKKLMVPDAVIDRINTVVRGSSARTPGR